MSASGTAELYSAVDPLLRRPVAIKVLSERLAANAETARRFARNALAAARLSGEQQVVTIYEVGEAAGRPFIVMEFLKGGSLADVLREDGIQPPGKAIPWLKQAAIALDRAHEQGLVHGDVKPSNLLFDETGHVHVADFGLVDGFAPEFSTVAGATPVTGEESASIYRAPEQAQGLAAGPAADEYALAVIGFELLTGSRPLEDEWPGSYRLPMSAGAVFDRALAVRPGDRFESCSRFAAALGSAFADEGRVPLTAARSRGVWRARVRPLVGLLLLFAGGAAAAIAATHHRHAKPTAVAVSRPSPIVRETVTAKAPVVTVHDRVTVQAPAAIGKTVVQTVTAQAPTSTTQAPAATTALSLPAPGGSSASLALAGYRRLQAGDAVGALPFLRAAAVKLEGAHTLDEAYNDYNLAMAITKTQGCVPQARRLLEESESIQGHRREIDQLRETCSGRG